MAGVGLAGSFVVMGLQWLRGSFFGLGISHFDLVWVNSFLIFALDEVSCGGSLVYKPPFLTPMETKV
jgi:hypothetical protein